VGYIVTVQEKTIYHAGDTELIPEMKDFDPIDVAILPIGCKFTMPPEEAIEVAQILKPKIVIPMHIHDSNPKEFKKQLESSTKLKVAALSFGEAFYLE
jgi:L-ascorbate metabolism protein UlaG (beta-lactamase superfamily)